MTLPEIKTNISNWNEVRNENSNKAYNLLKSGSVFQISRNDFSRWNSAAEFMHLYLGYNKSTDKLEFYLIDSLADNISNETPVITIKEFIQPQTQAQSQSNTQASNSPFDLPLNSINDIIYAFNEIKTRHFSAIIPTFRWILSSQEWFEEVHKDKNVVRVFKIPFLDFKNLFSSDNVDPMDSILLFFTLRDNTPRSHTAYKNATDNHVAYKNRIDVFLCRYNANNSDQGVFSFMKNHPLGDVTTPYPPFSKRVQSANIAMNTFSLFKRP